MYVWNVGGHRSEKFRDSDDSCGMGNRYGLFLKKKLYCICERQGVMIYIYVFKEKEKYQS